MKRDSQSEVDGEEGKRKKDVRYSQCFLLRDLH